MITFFDITIFAIIIIFSFSGLYQGIIAFSTRIIGFIASIMLTYLLYPYLTEVIIKYVDNEVIRTVIAGIISYIISLILCIFIVHKFLAVISFMRNGFIDKFLGLLAGLSTGLAISIILFFVTMIFTSSSYLKSESFEEFMASSHDNKYSGMLKDSLTSDYLDELSKNIIIIIPSNILKSIKLLQNKDLSSLENSSKKSQNEKKFSQELQDELDDIFFSVDDESN